MNKARRKAITAIAQRLADVRIDLSNIAEEEREYYDNMPPSIQCARFEIHCSCSGVCSCSIYCYPPS